MANLEQFRKSFLTAATFAQRAFKEIEGLSKEEYWRRTKRHDGVKQLIEEVLPLALVAKQLDIPGRRVRCKYLSKSTDICDAEIKISGEWVDSGFLKSRYNVEITTAQFKNEHFMREALARCGSVFDDPCIHQIRSKHRGNDQIVSRAVAQDSDQVIKDAIQWISDAIAKKADKPYPQPCFLIVAVDPGRPLALGEWFTVVKSFPRDVAKRRFDFTFLVHASVGTVHYVG